MEHTKKLAELHKESLQNLEDYIKLKKELKEDDQAKLHTAKEEWQVAWIKVVEVLMVLERLEI
ncbi:MAG: hypothetical protein LH619_08605 [Chitinophagaceae bacterium]|nr:hypothetical protein [Chitinophagaceae bacterium]